MIGAKVIILTSRVVGEVLAVQMDHRGNWCLLIADGSGKLHSSEHTGVMMATSAPMYPAAVSGLPALPAPGPTHHESPIPAAVFGEPMTIKQPIPVETVQTSTVMGPGIPGQKFPNGTRVRRKPSIDPPMPEAIFTVELYKASHGMKGEPRYWGRRDVNAPDQEMEAGYESQLEEVKP